MSPFVLVHLNIEEGNLQETQKNWTETYCPLLFSSQFTLMKDFMPFMLTTDGSEEAQLHAILTFCANGQEECWT